MKSAKSRLIEAGRVLDAAINRVAMAAADDYHPGRNPDYEDALLERKEAARHYREIIEDMTGQHADVIVRRLKF